MINLKTKDYFGNLKPVFLKNKPINDFQKLKALSIVSRLEV